MYFSSGRQTHRFNFCVCSPVRRVALTDTVAFKIKFEWSKACLCYVKSHQERSNWICETTKLWDASETCRGVAGIIYTHLWV